MNLVFLFWLISSVQAILNDDWFDEHDTIDDPLVVEMLAAENLQLNSAELLSAIATPQDSPLQSFKHIFYTSFDHFSNHENLNKLSHFSHINAHDLYEARQATVAICGMYKNVKTGETWTSAGTGGYINKTHVVSTAHTVEKCRFNVSYSRPNFMNSDQPNWRMWKCMNETHFDSDDRWELINVWTSRYKWNCNVERNEKSLNSIVYARDDPDSPKIGQSVNGVNENDIAVFESQVTSEQFIKLNDFKNLRNVQLKNDFSDLLIVGYPPIGFISDKYYDVYHKGNSYPVSGASLQDFFGKDSLPTFAISKEFSFDSHESPLVVVHRVPTWGQYSGSIIYGAEDLTGDLIPIGMHGGGYFKANTAILFNHPFIQRLRKEQSYTSDTTQCKNDQFVQG